MCGITGFSGKDNFDKHKIKTLIVWNALARGLDSTGLYSPKNNLKKSLLSGDEFVVTEKEDFLEDNFLIAHVRAKTVGANSIKNTHPFCRGKYILCHNGTLKNHIDLIDKYDLNLMDFDVDSDVICGSLDKSDNMLDVIKSIDGPAALLITKTDDEGIMYVFRNKDRPLFKGYIDANMYISSLKESLIFIGCKHIKEFKEDVLYKIKEGKILTSSTIKNEPYIIPKTVTVNNFSKNNIFSNCLIRCLVDEILYHDNNPIKACIKLIKGKYYRAFQLTKDDQIKIHDDVTSCNWFVDSSKFNPYDFIKADDYVRAIVPITAQFGNKVLLQQNEVAVVRSVWEETVSLYNPFTELFIVMADKINLVKLDKVEIDRYIEQNISNIDGDSCPNINILLNKQLQLPLALNYKPGEVFETNEVEVESDTVDDSETEYEEIAVDYFDLKMAFEDMDDKLERLIGLISDQHTTLPEIQLAIVELIDDNSKNKDYFLAGYEEEIETK